MNAIKKFFSWANPKRYASGLTFTAYDYKNVDEVISKTEKSVEQYCENAVAESDTVPNYQVRELGGVNKAQSSGAKLNRHLDATSKEAENNYQKALKDKEEHLKELPVKEKRLSGFFKQTVRSIISRRRIKLSSLLPKRLEAENRKTEIEQDIETLSKDLPKSIHTEKGYEGQRNLIVTGLGVTLLGEMATTHNALQILGADPLTEFPLVVTITASLFILAKGIVYCGKRAEIIQDNEGAKENVYDYFLFLLVGMAICFTIGLSHMRIDFLEQTGEEVSWMIKAMLYMLGPVLFAVCVVLTLFLSNTTEGTKGLYSTLLKKLKKVQREIDRLDRRINRIKLRYSNEYNREKQNYFEQLEAVQVDELARLEDVLLEKTIILNDVLAISRQYKDQFNFSMLSIFKSSRGDLGKKLSLSPEWTDLNLDNHDAKYAHPFKESVTPKNNHMKKLINDLLRPAVLILGIFLGACSVTTEKEENHLIIHLVDHTSFSQDDYKVQGRDILEISGIDEGVFQGLTYHAGSISDVSINKMHMLSIEPANKYSTNSLTRKKEVKKLGTDLDSVLNLVYPKQSGQYGNTELFLPLTRAFEQIVGFPENEKSTLILQSDLIHNNYGLSLYTQDMKNNPDEIISQKLNETIPKDFGASRKLDIVVLHSPSRAEDRDFQNVFRVFKTCFEKYANVNVSLKANL